MEEQRGVPEPPQLPSFPDISQWEPQIAVALFVLATFFHESHTQETGWGVVVIVLLYLISFFVQEENRAQIGWTILQLLARLLSYIFVGCLWIFPKLYIELASGRMDSNAIRACASELDCVLSHLLTMKWCLFRWCTMWPMSIASTVLRNPFNSIFELFWDNAKLSLARLAVYATSTQSTSIWFIFLAIFLYAIIGVFWGHLKLYLDIRFNELPSPVARDLQNLPYVEFVHKNLWLVVLWILTWPISVIFTLLKRPFALLCDLAPTRTLVWIVEKAKVVK